jgi:hypothetical protein
MDYRYLYLYQKDQYFKIGITNKPQRRQKENGCQTAELLLLKRIFWARWHEQRLHKVYERHRVRYGNKSGCTEWFKLSWLQVVCLRIRILFIWVQQLFFILFLAFCGCFAAFLAVFS